MKQTIFSLFAAMVVAATSGCATGVAHKGCSPGCDGNCNQCGLKTAFEDAQREYGPVMPEQGAMPQAEGVVIRGNCGPNGCPPGGGGAFAFGGGGGIGGREYGHTRPQFNGPAGPPSAAITYPYYTTRGPRDFLLKNPPPIGP